MKLFSPAKINLFLRILKKRTDGYHEIASLFQAIDLGDRLTFTLSSQDKLTCSDAQLPCDETNLISKAVALFRRKSGLRFAINIHLEKNIPMQAGLGGGSGNAATTLWGLNALHHHRYTDVELQSWSAEIGSDIPFFFSHGTAYCTGRGEHVRNLPHLTLPPLALFKPKEGIATPAVYKALQLHECSATDPEELLNQFYNGKIQLVNDLEKPAFRLLPTLDLYKKQIEKECPTVAMSGSGTAFFAFTPKATQKTLNRSPSSWFQVN